MVKVSIVIPTYNEEGNIRLLAKRINDALSSKDIEYELIFVDDHSTDATYKEIQEITKKYRAYLYLKKGKKGKAHSLLEGFSYATYPYVCMIDADLQYPPESIPDMLKKIENNKVDIIVARRREYNTSFTRRIVSHTFQWFFGQVLHNLSFDVQSGLKVFRREIIKRISLNPTPWTFDLEFLVKARNAGYKIESYDIYFDNRYCGKSKVSLLQASLEIGIGALKVKLEDLEIVPFPPETIEKEGAGFHYKGNKFVNYNYLNFGESAFFRLTLQQIFLILTLIVVFFSIFLLNWKFALVTAFAVITFLYFSDIIFNLFLIYQSLSKRVEIEVVDRDIREREDQYWPKYTIFCPLYKEWEVLPQFITAISRLEYPKNKLQVLLLLEEDDKKTIQKIQAYNLPFYFEVIIMPNSKPKTKPKALNYGLRFAKGKYSVIYDAEDFPDPKQLKKAVMAYEKVEPNVVCLQARLNFYNPYQNILTRVFTAEYSLWFDLVLTGLQSIKAPIPLGGTSNHFRTFDLYRLKGWDAFNVTEDCDLGMRLAKQGYLTALLDSETLEEANSDLSNWFSQRSRWIKGYIQTYFVHMRNPLAFMSNWRKPNFIPFQLVIGGKIFSLFVNPIMWLITFIYFIFRAEYGQLIESFFPAPIFYLGVVSMVFGNFLYLYYYMLGCAKHGYHDITKYVFLVPFYWLGMSFAAWVAIYGIIVKPYYWSKTVHGLHLNHNNVVKQAEVYLGEELVNGSFRPVLFDKEMLKSKVIAL